MKKNYVAAIALLFSLNVEAGLDSQAKLTGTVLEFDEHAVTLLNKGNKSTVDRKFFKEFDGKNKDSKIKVGQYVEVTVNMADLVKKQTALKK